jgi:hypothetical protein
VCARFVDVAVVVMWLRLGWSFGDGHNRGSRNGVVPVLMVGVRERDGGDVVRFGVAAVRVWMLPPRHSCRRRHHQPSHDRRWLGNIHRSEEAGRRRMELWTKSINH